MPLKRTFRWMFCTFILLACDRLYAQQQPELPPPGQAMTPESLNDLVAPIALYPDPLLSQILVASTYPLELVRAGQWLQRNPGVTGPALTQLAEQQNWDPSVQALVLFPDLLRRLNQDITWTTNLGNAFLDQQADVMDAVQRMRSTAQQSGKLSSTSQQTVTTMRDSGQPMIEIEPADASTIYVPDYNPVSIWGPPAYYPYAAWQYPRYAGGAYFGFGIGIPLGVYFGGSWGGWGGWGWNPGWRAHNIIINNNFIYRHNFNSSRGVSPNGRGNWSHDSSHRQGVPYANRALSTRYSNTVRENLRSRSPAEQRQVRPPSPQQSPQSAPERVGNRQISPNAPNGNRGAFGGVREGEKARVNSDHGFSSLGPARTGGAAPRTGVQRGGGVQPAAPAPQRREGGQPEGAQRGGGRQSEGAGQRGEGAGKRRDGDTPGKRP